jgi:hypothetical protein
MKKGKPKLMSACGMWAAVPTAVLVDSELSMSSRLLYSIIVTHCRPRRGNMRCFAGLELLAKECGSSVSSVKRWLLELSSAGVIARERRRNTSTVTFLTDLTERYKLPNGAEELTSEPVNEELTHEPLSRCCEVDVEQQQRASALSVVETTDEQPKPQPYKLPSETWDFFKGWCADMRERHGMPEAVGIERMKGYFWQCVKATDSVKPFERFDEMERAIAALKEKGLALPSAHGLITLSNGTYGVERLLAYASRASSKPAQSSFQEQAESEGFLNLTKARREAKEASAAFGGKKESEHISDSGGGE